MLAVLERLSALAAALAWRSTSFTPTLIAFAILALTHRALRAQLRTRSEATAFERIVTNALSRDPSADDSTKPMAIVQAMHHAARASVDVMLPLAGDVVATGVGLFVLAHRGDAHLLFLAIAVTGCGVIAGRLLFKPSENAHLNYVDALEGVFDAFDGRVEVRAAGMATDFGAHVRGTIERWRTAAMIAQARSALLGQLPALVAVVFVLASPSLQHVVTQNVIVLIAVSPSFLGLVRTAHELSMVSARVAPLRPFMEVSLKAAGLDIADASRIEWSDVSLEYGPHVVLSHVGFAARPGETLALVGPNGAGKTTLLLVALGLRHPSTGSVHVGETDLKHADVDAWRRVTHYLPQRPYLMPRRTIRDAIRFLASDLDDAAMKAALTRVRLWERLETFPGDPLAVITDTLSAGEKQRLALARMLCREADVYLLDEPDANLDAEGVREVAELLRELAAKGKIVVVAAHTPEVIAAADRVVRLEAGRVTSTEDKRRAQQTG